MTEEKSDIISTISSSRSTQSGGNYSSAILPSSSPSNLTQTSGGNFTPHSAAYDALKQQDLNHALEVVLNWNSNVMQPTDAGLASALSKLRTKPIPDLHENLLLRDNLLTQLVGIITSSSLRQQCVDYSC